MTTLEELLELGYRGIAVIEHVNQKDPETKTEICRTIFVARDKEGPVRITMQWQYIQLPEKQTIREVLKREVLSEEEYRNLVHEKQGVWDDFNYYYKQRLKRRSVERAELYQESAKPLCPYCRRVMAVKYRKRDNEPFWGCTFYPQCSGTRSIQNADKSRLKRLGLIK